MQIYKATFTEENKTYERYVLTDYEATVFKDESLFRKVCGDTAKDFFDNYDNLPIKSEASHRKVIYGEVNYGEIKANKMSCGEMKFELVCDSPLIID